MNNILQSFINFIKGLFKRKSTNPPVQVTVPEPQKPIEPAKEQGDFPVPLPTQLD